MTGWNDVLTGLGNLCATYGALCAAGAALDWYVASRGRSVWRQAHVARHEARRIRLQADEWRDEARELLAAALRGAEASGATPEAGCMSPGPADESKVGPPR
jgi:hypothetical protein